MTKRARLFAYVDTSWQNAKLWIATVQNKSFKFGDVTAIDKCVIQDADEPRTWALRCHADHGQFTVSAGIEGTKVKAIGARMPADQLESTILLDGTPPAATGTVHAAKVAQACSRRLPGFVELEPGTQRAASEAKFRKTRNHCGVGFLIGFWCGPGKQHERSPKTRAEHRPTQGTGWVCGGGRARAARTRYYRRPFAGHRAQQAQAENCRLCAGSIAAPCWPWLAGQRPPPAVQQGVSIAESYLPAAGACPVANQSARAFTTAWTWLWVTRGRRSGPSQPEEL